MIKNQLPSLRDTLPASGVAEVFTMSQFVGPLSKPLYLQVVFSL